MTKTAKIIQFKPSIRYEKTDELKKQWDLWVSVGEENVHGCAFGYEEIHAELNRRGEGAYCAV